MTVILILSAVFIGMSKTGIQGINTLSIPLLALAYGAKESTGLILPMLCFADLIAVIYYRKSAEWKLIIKLLPATIAGFFIALAVDSFIPSEQFGRLMALCILAGMAVMFWTDSRNKTAQLQRQWWYSPTFGLLGGFSTMIGNAAGPVMAVYLLSMKVPKLTFVGTSAWFFLIVNYLKIPLQVLAWDNISWHTLKLNALCIPFILIGCVAGVIFVKKFPEKAYRKFIIIMTVASSALLLLK